MLAVSAFAVGIGAAPAQSASPCADFQLLSEEAAKRATVVQAAMKARADRKEVCAAMTNFVEVRGGRGQVPR